jgi:hypothetical protein
MAWDAGALACGLTVWLPTLLMVLIPPANDSPEFWWERGREV